MDEQQARHLMQAYINGWKQSDLSGIIVPLSEDCVVIESYGPTYNGIAEIKCWVECWIASGSQVIQWDLRSFYFSEKDNTTFCEWDFHCVAHQKDYALKGASLVKFSGHEITLIHEYRMTHVPYPWKKGILQVE